MLNSNDLKAVTDRKLTGDVLTLVITQGLFVMGKMTPDGRLEKPRILTFLENGKRVQLSPLPGIPKYLYIGVGNPFYSIPARDKSLYDLYRQVTAPGVDPND